MTTNTPIGFTSHGHPIPGITQHGRPPKVARCGGVAACRDCRNEVDAYENPAPNAATIEEIRDGYAISYLDGAIERDVTVPWVADTVLGHGKARFDAWLTEYTAFLTRNPPVPDVFQFDAPFEAVRVGDTVRVHWANGNTATFEVRKQGPSLGGLPGFFSSLTRNNIVWESDRASIDILTRPNTKDSK